MPASEYENNKSLVFGAITTGIGHSQLDQQMAILNMPLILQRRGQKSQEEV